MKRSLILLTLILCSCYNQKELESELSDNLQNDLRIWQLDTRVNTRVENNLLYVEIQFLGEPTLNKEAPYYYDTSSNEMIANFLVYQNKADFFEFDSSVVELNFVGFKETIRYFFGKKSFQNIEQNFSNTYAKLNVNQSLIFLEYKDIIFLDGLIELIIKKKEYQTDENVNYWTLIKGFSIYCNSRDIASEYLEIMVTLNFLLEQLSIEDEHAKKLSEFINQLLQECDFNEKNYNYDSIPILVKKHKSRSHV